MIKAKTDRSEYMRNYKRKRYNEEKDNPKEVIIKRNGYELTLIEVHERKRRGMIDGENIHYPQPKYSGNTNYALKSISKLT